MRRHPPWTRRHLHAALQAFLKGHTTIIIAHRLSAVKQADRCLVFEEGRIIEAGGHDELLRNQGYMPRSMVSMDREASNPVSPPSY